ncbi:MAG: dihydrolipoyl dehydrogenase [Chloroflexi bacterium HGW-Chloroflexi-1]|nr:MAG: dihydrolipoyl dehydrogenase [Chloroflexi bacterium HGW-Chloroflexi-1]
MSNQNYDVVIIGGGPGGYVAAVRAAQLSQKVAIIEREFLGGVCLNIGCVPTKSLLRNAEIVNLLREGKDYGFAFESLTVDYAVAQKRSRQVSDRLVKGVQFLMKKNKIDVYQGIGCLRTATQVEVTAGPDVAAVSGQKFDGVLNAKNIIIATGATPRSLPGMQVDGVKIITSREALELTAVPRRLVVVGAGAIGMEFAYLFRSYGAAVTVIEMLPHVLPLEDDDTAAEVARAFKKQGIATLVDTRTAAVEPTVAGVTVRVKDQGTGAEQAIEADVVLVAIGVAPNSQGIGLAAAGVQTDQRGFIPVDETMRTNVPGIYAVGDVTGKLLLAHVASAQGIVAAEHSAGHETRPIREADYAFMPRATYCHPQVASLGLTEAQAQAQGYEIKVGKFPFLANGKALGLNDKDGFVKIISDARYGEILGAHLVGPEVTELLPELVLAHTWELTAAEIARTVHAHPTLAEVIMEAAHAVEGQAIHV